MSPSLSTCTSTANLAELRWRRLDSLGRQITLQLNLCQDPETRMELLRWKYDVTRMKREALRG